MAPTSAIMMEKAQKRWASLSPCERAKREVTTALGTVFVAQLDFARYRVCIEPSCYAFQQVIAERLKRSPGWSHPDGEMRYFTKIFSLRADVEALAAIREE
jgi:hypothetical protein